MWARAKHWVSQDIQDKEEERSCSQTGVWPAKVTDLLPRMRASFSPRRSAYIHLCSASVVSHFNIVFVSSAACFVWPLGKWWFSASRALRLSRSLADFSWYKSYISRSQATCQPLCPSVEMEYRTLIKARFHVKLFKGIFKYPRLYGVPQVIHLLKYLSCTLNEQSHVRPT